MKIIVKKDNSGIKTDVVFVSQKDIKSLQKNLSFLKGNFKGKWAESLFIPNAKNSENLLVVGLGEEEQLSYEKVRRAVAIAFKQLKSHWQTEAKINLSSLQRKQSSDWNCLAQAVAESLLLTNYKCDKFKFSSKDKDEVEIKTICLCTPSAKQKNVEQGVKTGIIIGESVNVTRKVANYPGKNMTPSLLAKEAVDQAKGTKLKVTVWDDKKLKQEGMGGILGVGAGSSEQSRFIIMEYKGAKDSSKPICFVGKGVTFDTGGISLKPGHAMDEMKFDMCGAAATLGTLLAIERLKLKVNVLGLIPSAENMPGQSATKPGDILTARNKKTMEILNTDAEGRLILADALSYASEKKPQVIFDAATLTGAIVMSLGNLFTGFFTKNETLVKKIQTSAEKSGESVWRMPLVTEHATAMASRIADVSNLSSMRGAGSSTAAAFLENFVDKDIPWAHFDIAGTAYNMEKRLEYCSPRMASGVIVRTFVELAKSYAKKG